MRFQFLLCCAFSMALASCSPATAPEEATVEDQAASVASAPPPPILDFWYTKDTITVENKDTRPVELQRLVVNRVENDSDCDIKLFKKILPQKKETVNVPNCGNFTHVQAITDIGNAEEAPNYLIANTSITISSRFNYETNKSEQIITFFNNGPDRVTLNKITLNEQQNDPKCAIKIFKTIEANSYETVAADNCGKISKAEIITDIGSYNSVFDN